MPVQKGVRIHQTLTQVGAGRKPPGQVDGVRTSQTGTAPQALSGSESLAKVKTYRSR